MIELKLVKSKVIGEYKDKKIYSQLYEGKLPHTIQGMIVFIDEVYDLRVTDGYCFVRQFLTKDVDEKFILTKEAWLLEIYRKTLDEDSKHKEVKDE